MSKNERSSKLFERACRVFPGGVNSPVRSGAAVGANPVFIDRAEGAYVFDVDGNRYVDLVGTWGPAIVGHAHPAIVEAVHQASSKGLSFGACCEAEITLAELIIDALPSVEMLRFVSSGTEATMSALRLARAATGRSAVIKFHGCYHGHVDSLLVAAGSGAATMSTPSSAGVPSAFADTTLLAPYNDAAAVSQLFDQHKGNIAAVIVEPVAGNMGLVSPIEGFLEELRRLCDENESLLIFDEVMTGFRVAWGGYQNLCDVRPDITCLGKVIGGGLPVAAYGGARDLMKHVSPLGPMYQAGTLSGNPVAMAAGIATLNLCKVDGFYESLSDKSAYLVEGLKRAAECAVVDVQCDYLGGMLGLGFSAKPICNFDDAHAANHGQFAAFYRAMIGRCVWLPPSGYEALFMSDAHSTKDLDTIIDSAAAAFSEIGE